MTAHSHLVSRSRLDREHRVLMVLTRTLATLSALILINTFLFVQPEANRPFVNDYHKEHIHVLVLPLRTVLVSCKRTHCRGSRSRRWCHHIEYTSATVLGGDKSVFSCQHASDTLITDEKFDLTEQRSPSLAYLLKLAEFTFRFLKADKDFVTKNESWAFQYVAGAHMGDKDVFMAAVQKDGQALEFVSDTFKGDKDIVMAAVKNGQALEFASDAIKADKDVVLAAIKSYPDALIFALEGLNQDSAYWMQANEYFFR